jgi:hypothetical protein
MAARSEAGRFFGQNLHARKEVDLLLVDARFNYVTSPASFLWYASRSARLLERATARSYSGRASAGRPARRSTSARAPQKNG